MATVFLYHHPESWRVSSQKICPTKNATEVRSSILQSGNVLDGEFNTLDQVSMLRYGYHVATDSDSKAKITDVVGVITDNLQ